MTKFLLMFLVIYSTMHAIFFLRVRVLLGDRRLAHVLCLAWLVLMIVLPMVSRIVENAGHDPVARFIGWIAYAWMGFIVFAFLTVIDLSLYDMATWALNAMKIPLLPTLSGRTQAWVTIAVALLACSYGYYESRSLRVERVRIETAKLPASTPRLKIVQISDVHLGLLAREQHLSEVVAMVQQEDPDLVVCTGDLLDGRVTHLDGLSGILASLHPRLGKYAVTGNHEAYVGLAESAAFFEKAGFTLLRGEVKTLNPVLNIVGIDDPATGHKTAEVPLLNSAQDGLFTLYLKHRPSVPAPTLGLFDLQLSGHTHGGQLFPFHFVVARQYPMLSGLFRLAHGSRLYTSRGSGTWGPQLRLLAPPEVTAIELVRKPPPATDQP